MLCCSGKTASPISPADSFVSTSSMPPMLAKEASEGSSSASTSNPPTFAQQINHDNEVEDASEYTDTDLEGVEEHKSVILHLLSQLKLGMDLTKVSSHKQDSILICFSLNVTKGNFY